MLRGLRVQSENLYNILDKVRDILAVQQSDLNSVVMYVVHKCGLLDPIQPFESSNQFSLLFSPSMVINSLQFCCVGLSVQYVLYDLYMCWGYISVQFWQMCPFLIYLMTHLSNILLSGLISFTL